MLAHLLLALLALAPVQDKGAPPDPAKVKAAVAELDEAFGKGKAPERVAAIGRAAQFVDGAVIERIARGLRDEDATVRGAAIEALRFMKHASALEALQDLAKRDKKLAKDPELFAKLIKAVGQHASPASLAWLADCSIDVEGFKVLEARVMSLANLRTDKSLEALVNLMRTAQRDRVQPYMETFRLALTVLTGADQGVSQDAWIAWWNEHKGDFKVSATAPALPKEMQMRWDSFWGNPVVRERAKKRGERGDDPETGGGK